MTVSSNGQNSSQALIFLSTRSDPDFRFLHISWVNFRDIHINWNEELSLQAVCEDCDDIPDLTYSWDLFLVNATEKNTVKVPFCSTVGLLGTSASGAILKLSQSDLQSSPRGSLTRRHPPERSPMPPSWTALHNLGSVSTGSTAGGHHIL
ncbi:Polycystic kidney disease protein 1-like 1, partial [Lemmus lemmus]